MELNRLIRQTRPHYNGLTIEQTRDFLIIYLIFGVLYVLIDRKYSNTYSYLKIVKNYQKKSKITENSKNAMNWQKAELIVH